MNRQSRKCSSLFPLYNLSQSSTDLSSGLRKRGYILLWWKAISTPVILFTYVSSLIVSGSNWWLLVVSSSARQLLIVTSSYQQLLIVIGSYQKLLTVTASYQLLVVTSSYWQLLVVASSCWQLLVVSSTVTCSYWSVADPGETGNRPLPHLPKVWMTAHPLPHFLPTLSQGVDPALLVGTGSYQQLMVVTSTCQQILVVGGSQQQFVVITNSYWLVFVGSYQKLLVVATNRNYRKLRLTTNNYQ